METEGAGFGIVDEAGRIIGAHLKEHAHFKFTQSFSAEEPVYIVVGVARGDYVEAMSCPFADELVEENRWIRGGFRVAGSKAEILLEPELVELLETMDEKKHGSRIGGSDVVIPRCHLVGQPFQDFRQISLFCQSDLMRDTSDDLFQVVPRWRSRRTAVT